MSVKTIEKMVEWVEENIKGKPTLDEMSSHVSILLSIAQQNFMSMVMVNDVGYEILAY